jgi:hypothetical protein
LGDLRELVGETLLTLSAKQREVRRCGSCASLTIRRRSAVEDQRAAGARPRLARPARVGRRAGRGRGGGVSDRSVEELLAYVRRRPGAADRARRAARRARPAGGRTSRT